MSVPNLGTVVGIGERLFLTKLYSTSMYCLWIYDYFITLGDEVNFGWSGRKGWVFVLFLANRYLPALHIIYKSVIMFAFTISLCERSRWEPAFYSTVAAVLAQLTVAVRVYAITEKRKLYGGVLFALLIAQLVAGILFTVIVGIKPIAPLPPINLDAFRFCIFQQWRPGEMSFVIIAAAFDIFALRTIFIATTGPRRRRYPGIPSLLETILRDATIYFLLMFVSQLLLLFFLFLVPVQIQFLPGVTHTIFLPVMACRLMLSLKKVASEPKGPWTLTNAPEIARMSIGRTHESDSGTTPPTFDVSREISGTLPPPNEDVELGEPSRPPRSSRPL